MNTPCPRARRGASAIAAAAAALIAAGFSPVTAHARFWNVSYFEGAWSDPQKWCITYGGAGGAGVPAAGDRAYLSSLDAIDRVVTYDGNYTAQAALLELFIDAVDTGSMTLRQGRNTLATTNTHVGYSDGRVGAYVQDGGAHLVSNNLSLGGLGTSRGAYTLNGGTLSASELWIGYYASQAAGLYRQTGGQATFEAIRVAASGEFQLDGGLLIAGRVDDQSTQVTPKFTFNGGTFRLTNSNAQIGPGTFLGQTLQLTPNKRLEMDNDWSVWVKTGGMLYIPGGSVQTSALGTVTNDGTLFLDSPAASISGGYVVNRKLMTGSGQVHANLNNYPDAELRLATGQWLRFHGTTNNNFGLINLVGGVVEFEHGLLNSTIGTISGHGTILTGPGGFVNEKHVTFSGGVSDVRGAMTNREQSYVLVTGGATVTFHDAVAVNAGDFRVSAGSTACFLGPVTLSGSGQFTGPGLKIFEQGASNVAFLQTGGATMVDSSATVIARSVREQSLDVAGRVVIQSDGTPDATSRVGTIAVTGGGGMDLRDNALIVTEGNVGSFANGSYNGITGLIASGRQNRWNGSGLLTTDPRAAGGDDYMTLGVARAGDLGRTSFDGLPVDPDDVLVKFTFGGDANLDGKINIDDYGRIDGNVGSSGSVFGWFNGDFNYDGKINIDDYGIIDGNINRQGATSDSGSATSIAVESITAVPEPSGMILGLLISMGLRRHRRN